VYISYKNKRIDYSEKTDDCFNCFNNVYCGINDVSEEKVFVSRSCTINEESFKRRKYRDTFWNTTCKKFTWNWWL